MVRDERKVLLLGINDEDGHRPKMRIYTSAGKLISSFMVQRKLYFSDIFYEIMFCSFLR